MNATAGIIAAQVAAQTAASAQMIGLYSEVSQERFKQLVRESNKKVNLGTIRVAFTFSSIFHKMAILNVNGMHIVCFFPIDYIPEFPYQDIGEIANPMSVVRSKDDLQKLEGQSQRFVNIMLGIFVVGLVLFLVFLFVVNILL